MGGLSQQVDFTMGGLPQRMDIAGGSPQRGKSHRRAYSRRQRLGPLIGRSGPGPCRIGLGGSRVQRGLLRIGRSGALGLVSSDGAASLGLEPTGGGGRGSGSSEEGGAPVPTAAAKLAARGSLMQNLVRDIGFLAGLEAHWAFRFAFPQSARREFRVGLARREVKNFMLWAEPPARQTESVQT